MYPRHYSSESASVSSSTEADLEANRKGYLTTWQMEHLPFSAARSDAERRSFGSALRAAITTIAGAIMAVAFVAFLLGRGDDLTRFIAPSVRPVATGLIIIAVVASMAWVAYSAVAQTRATRDWEHARMVIMQVDAAHGLAQPVVDRIDGDQRYYVQIATRRFRTDKRTLAAFHAGEDYRVYYVSGPDDFYLVNAERLSE